LEESRNAIAQAQASLQQQGLDAATIDMLLASMRALQRDVQDEVTAYEKARDFDFKQVPFGGLGRMLIGLRIARHMSVSDLAEALGVDKGNVSRDERNYYRGITRERIERILAALNVELLITPVPKEAPASQTQVTLAPQGQTAVAPALPGGGWVMPAGFALDQPMSWPIENTPWSRPQSPMSGFVQAASSGGGPQAQNSASTQPAYANVMSSRTRAEAA
jgi:transcriptional regulator with XRE-family HTH domain